MRGDCVVYVGDEAAVTTNNNDTMTYELTDKAPPGALQILENLKQQAREVELDYLDTTTREAVREGFDECINSLLWEYRNLGWMEMPPKAGVKV